MNKFNGYALVLLLGTSICVGACGTSKKAKKKTEDVTVVTPPPVKADSAIIRKDESKVNTAIDQYKNIWSQKINYTTFQAKSSSTFSADGNSQDFNAQIRIIKDKAIWIHISALGGVVNVARGIITPDSIKAIVYLKKEYVNIPIEEAAKLLPVKVDFSTLQNVLVGNPFIDFVAPTDYNEMNGDHIFTTTNSEAQQFLVYLMNSNLLAGNQVKTNTGEQLLAQYTKHQLVNNQQIPIVRKLMINNKGKKGSLDMDLKEVNLNEELEMPFSIPKSYKPMNLH